MEGGGAIKRTLLDFGEEVVKRRFWVWICGIVLNIVAGTQYGFSLYSSAMRDKFEWSQSDISFVAIAGNLGLYVGFFIGLFYDWKGPRWTSIVSGSLASGGLFLTYMALLGHIPHPAVLIAFFYFFVGQGCWGLYEVGILTNMKNYSSSKRMGIVVGILVSAFGIASAIYSGVYSLFGASNVQNFILFMLIIILVASFAASFVMKVTIEGEDQDSHSSIKIIEEEDAEKPLVLKPTHSTDVTGWRLFLRADFYLLWFPFAFGAGAGLMVINQLGEVVFSLEGSESLKNFMVAIFAVSNCIGRISIGAISDYFEKSFERSAWMMLVLFITALAHGFFGFIQNKSILFIVVLLSGLGYGGLFALIPVLVGKFWGMKGVGVNFGFVALAAAAGSVSMNYFAGWEYDRKTNYLNEKGDERCRENDCFTWSFRLSCGLCILGIFVAGALFWFKTKERRSKDSERQKLLTD